MKQPGFLIRIFAVLVFVAGVILVTQGIHGSVIFSAEVEGTGPQITIPFEVTGNIPRIRKPDGSFLSRADLNGIINNFAKDEVARFTRRVGNTSENNFCNFENARLSRAVPISLKIAAGDGGATHFQFDQGAVYNFRMEVQGTSLTAIVENVISHEIQHILQALCTRKPIARYLDEGCSTLAEPPEYSIRRQFPLAKKACSGTYLRDLNGFKRLLTTREYPNDVNNVMQIYSIGSAFSYYIIERENDRGRNGNQQLIRLMQREGYNGAHHIGTLEQMLGQRIDGIYSDFKGWLCGEGSAAGNTVPLSMDRVGEMQQNLSCPADRTPDAVTDTPRPPFIPANPGLRLPDINRGWVPVAGPSPIIEETPAPAQPARPSPRSEETPPPAEPASPSPRTRPTPAPNPIILEG